MTTKEKIVQITSRMEDITAELVDFFEDENKYLTGVVLETLAKAINVFDSFSTEDLNLKAIEKDFDEKLKRKKEIEAQVSNLLREFLSLTDEDDYQDVIKAFYIK